VGLRAKCFQLLEVVQTCSYGLLQLSITRMLFIERQNL
jgi:hypothetical protein